MIAAGAENAQILDDALARPDDRNGFLGREEAVLIEPLERLKLMPLAEQSLEVFLGNVGVPRGNVDDQFGALNLTPRRSPGGRGGSGGRCLKRRGGSGRPAAIGMEEMLGRRASYHGCKS